MNLLVPANSVSSYKSNRVLPLKCEHCLKIFFKRKSDVSMSLKGHPDFALRFCSLKCHHLQRVKDTHIELSCEQCEKIIVKQISWLKGNKHNFCSRSCNAKYQNAHKTLGVSRKSKAESYLASLIRGDFRQLALEENIRDVIPSGLEFDLYMPAIQLAVELNGPLHYFPIYGQEKLELIRERDTRKQSEARSIGCCLIVIDISKIKYWPETEVFLLEQYNSKIKPLIKTLSMQSSASQPKGKGRSGLRPLITGRLGLEPR